MVRPTRSVHPERVREQRRAERQDYDWQPVQSSAVKALCFVPGGRIEQRGKRAVTFGDLYVCFHTGSVYRYPSVSRADYNAIRHARSVGQALAALVSDVREGSAGYQKVGKLDG